MGLTFFWRAEGTTLDGTHDFSAGDTTATANGTVAINGTAALVGSNGVQVLGAGDHYRFDSASIIDRLIGSVGFKVRIQDWGGGAATLVYAKGNAYTECFRVALTGTDELRLQFNEDTGAAVSTLDTGAANLALDTTYFVTASWDQVNNYRRIRVYNSSGVLLYEELDDSTAYTAPANFSDSDNFRIGDASGIASQFYLDNIFVGNEVADADHFAANHNITSYTEYSTSGGGGGIVVPVFTYNLKLQGIQ